jgi:pyruvate/2-oxoglutarate dehydrogenase complex dihydrolipoamide acyltransferase (E2) component
VAAPSDITEEQAPGTVVTVEAPLQGTVAAVPVSVGDPVAKGAPLVILESMKMEHVVRAPVTGTVTALSAEPGAVVATGDPMARLEATGSVGPGAEGPAAPDLDAVRPDLAEVLDRQGRTLDAGRPGMVERRHGQGRRTARENIEDLCDAGSFTEYGSLAIAAQRGRRSLDELIERTPADGLVAGIGRVNGSRFGDRRSSSSSNGSDCRWCCSPRAAADGPATPTTR